MEGEILYPMSNYDKMRHYVTYIYRSADDPIRVLYVANRILELANEREEEDKASERLSKYDTAEEGVIVS